MRKNPSIGQINLLTTPKKSGSGIESMRSHDYFVYIMASDSGTLYIGVTNNLERRVYQHQHGLIEGFTKKYDCKKLVYFEHTTEIQGALAREKELKGWIRKRKEALIKTKNPSWKDLSSALSF